MSRTPGPPAPGKIAGDPERLVLNVPAAGEIVIFDRSWYNRAGVERVMGFCTEEQSKKFLKGVPLVEQAMVESGILLLKYWLEMSPQEQTRRPKDRIDDGRKVWKLIAMDLKSYSRWFDYSRAGRDVRRHRHGLCAVVRGPLRRQATGAPERDRAPAGQDPVR